MLPYTTYQIPNPSIDQTPAKGKWLHIILSDAPSPSESILIQKIIMALNANLDQEVLYHTQPPWSQLNIADTIESGMKLLISFGIRPSEFGLWIDLATPGIRFLESFTFILTIPLPDLEKNAAAKKELWKNMQHYLEMNQ